MLSAFHKCELQVQPRIPLSLLRALSLPAHSLIAVVMALSILGCGKATRSAAAGKMAERAAYPAHWWTPVAEEGAPEWEILPQAAKPGEVILSKRHELGL